MSGSTVTLPVAEAERGQVIQGAVEWGRRHGWNEPDFEAFLGRYYRHVALEDLRDRESADLVGLALSHRQLGERRPQGTARVRVYTPTVEEHGWATGHTVVEIVSEDMPFLVDSVTAELGRVERPIHVVIHPQLVVRRDVTGVLLEVLDLPVHDTERVGWPRDAQIESWMHVEIDRETDSAQLDLVASGLRRVLEDVRVSVEDHPRMRGAALRIAEELASQPPTGIDPADAEEATQLLRWLAEDHFTFLGYREYKLVEHEGLDALLGETGSGLGILRHDQHAASGSFSRLTPQARARARDRNLLLVTKANSRATVHRPAYLDYIGIKTFDENGQVTGERRFLGLFAASAYTDSVLRIPVVSRKVKAVLDRAGLSRESHSGKDLLQILETYPRDELFEISVDDLYTIAFAVMHLQERRRTRLFLRVDDYARFVSCLVYLPRERYTTEIRRAIERILLEAFGGSSIDYTTRVSESVLARLHFVVRVPGGIELPDVDPAELEARLVQAVRTWDEDLADALRTELGEELGSQLLRSWGAGLPQGYKEDVDARVAVGDLRRLEQLVDGPSANGAATVMNLYEPVGAAFGDRRFKLYRREPLSLTRVLPYLANLGVEVVDERPYTLDRIGGGTAYIYDFGLRREVAPAERSSELSHPERARKLFCEAFAAAWNGDAENDGFNRLVLTGLLTWRQVSVLRAYSKYLRQIGSTFSQSYLERCLGTHIEVAGLLVQLFETRFDPGRFDGQIEQERRDAEEELTRQIRAALDDVASLDQDRILRSFLGLILATDRTNYYVRRPAEDRRAPSLAFKLNPAVVPDLPDPRPAHEIFVYSPRVEGVHLRFGAVARGGLRWSDRREDFRIEILGLVKAQMVKNAVIVPTGAKGGFVAKHLPDPAVDRDAWLAEGIACYRTFICGLLDLTDNLVPDGQGGQTVVPPEQVLRHDGDDSYLVVAADKGTATFSDIANQVAADYGFWLGDAFASGGSAGYDHKAMGITARGAWESVKRHFREMGHDVQTQPTTVVGIGDMSGDVFGNGMLLSEQLQLVAAFDHRHVFLDPDPDPAASCAERRRLFNLPRSSWADYDASLISEGGGIFPRTAKSVPITPPVARRLGLAPTATAMTPAELMRAILTAPVDLLWNGGIGTYVKASSEPNSEVGDKANDVIRVNGRELRVRVIGEGGNLGLTQLGRVEAALTGVRVNTDAIDNSAGVDCSDHEVNIKILLDRVVADGDLTLKQRNQLLVAMTDDVSRLVLRDNYEQNVLLGNARKQSANMLTVHHRFIRALETQSGLDRALEYLPDDLGLAERAEAGLGLTSPEFSVLVAYAKLTLTDQIVRSDLPDDKWMVRTLERYFPPLLVDRYGDRLSGHPLRREIITTCLVNDMVNRGGITFAFRAQEETSASPEQVARAYMVCREIFDLPRFVAAVEALDNKVTTATQTTLYLEFRRLLDRSVRWFLQTRPGRLDIGAEIDRFGPVVAQLAPQLPDMLVGVERDALLERAARLEEQGVPEELARWGAAMLVQFMLLDITEVAGATGVGPGEVARVYLALSERYAIDAMLTWISNLARDDRWKALARAALRYDLYAALESLTVAVLTTTPEGDPQERVAAWERENAAAVARAVHTLEEIRRLDSPDIASLSVVLRTLRGVVRPTASPAYA